MKSPESLGMNRTGIKMSPIDTAKMTDTTDASLAAAVVSPTDLDALFAYRGEFMRSAEPIGTVPLPGTLKGAAKTVIQKLKGDRPELFLDKLGERIAFERSGTRLYELLLNKCRERPDDLPGLPLNVLESIRDDELRHFHLVSDVMRRIGGDETAQTPAADVNGVVASAWVTVIADPRTTVTQALQAVLMVELTDNDAWPQLVALAMEQNMGSVAEEFRRAEAAEQRHLAEIRGLMAKAVLGQRGGTVH